MQAASNFTELFRHVSAEKAVFYRCMMDVFAAAKRQYRLQLRPDEVWLRPAVFAQLLQRRAELQTVALEDITSRLQAPVALAGSPEADVAKLHEPMRERVRVFEALAENAQAFMASVARSIELQQADAGAVASYKRRLIRHRERFMGDLVRHLGSSRSACQ